ncbi:MAG: site-specific integrase [Chloroflexi bacterium]|nr:site-specific integrase [Chloroflexota bacterium]
MPNNAGSVYQRKEDGRWLAALTVNGKRKTIYAKNEREARKKLADLQRTLGTCATLPDPGKKTVNDLLALWLDTASHTVRRGTLADYRDICDRHISPHLGHIRLSNLRPEHLQALYNYLSEKGHTRIPSLVHSLIHRALRMAVMWGWLPGNPADRVLVPRHKAKRKTIWAMDELSTFLHGTREHRYGPLWAVAVASGCRIGELTALKWDDVRWAENTITIRATLRAVKGQWVEEPPKTEAGMRAIVLPSEAMDAMRRQRARQAEWRLKAGETWQDAKLVFTTETGTPLIRASVEHALTWQCKRLGIPELSPHGLRHLCASLLLDRGLPLTVVSERLGHSNCAITANVYAHNVRRKDQDAAGLMQTILSAKVV